MQDAQHGLELLRQHSTLIETALHATNVLTLIARQDMFYFYINRKFIGSASDTTLHQGAIGLLASSSQHPTAVAFRNLRIWDL